MLPNIAAVYILTSITRSAGAVYILYNSAAVKVVFQCSCVFFFHRKIFQSVVQVDLQQLYAS